jgi:hypothetical protein
VVILFIFHEYISRNKPGEVLYASNHSTWEGVGEDLEFAASLAYTIKTCLKKMQSL